MCPRLRDWSGSPDGDRRDARPPTAARLYTEALRALARRELTSLQLREKLLHGGGRASDVEDVLGRLRQEGALDDRRAARVYAQTAFRQRKRARGRIQVELEHLGVPASVAADVLDEICGDDIEQRRLEQAVIHGLRGTRRDSRDDAARHLFVALVRKGYDPDDIRLAFAKAGIDAAVLDE